MCYLTRQVFNNIDLLEYRQNHNSSGIDYYWSLQEQIAEDVNHAPYDDIEEYREPNNRSCFICGAIHQTSEKGGFKGKSCTTKHCKNIKSFFDLRGNINEPQYLISGKETVNEILNRASWLRRFINKAGFEKVHYGGALAQIPEEIRFEFLLNAMIKRIAHEDGKNYDWSKRLTL